MNDWMRKFFTYLDRYFVRHNSLPSLHVSGLKFFKELVYDVVKQDVVRAMLQMINLEREVKYAYSHTYTHTDIFTSKKRMVTT